MNGQGVSGEIPVYLGAVANPTVEATGLGILGLRKKIAAGADFIQTQAVSDIEGFRAWMEQVRQQALHQRVRILASVLPIKSLDMARRMRGHSRSAHSRRIGHANGGKRERRRGRRPVLRRADRAIAHRARRESASREPGGGSWGMLLRAARDPA